MITTYFENYTYFEDYHASAFTKGRNGKKLRYIIIHHWGREGQSFEGVLTFFCANPKVETSTHYVVEGGRVACIVSPKNIAYHAGNWAYNEVSIGIECRPEATEGDYITTAKLISKLWQTYGRLELIGHRDVPNVATFCPGKWNLAKLNHLALSYYKKEDSPSKWAKPAWESLTQKGIVDGKRPKDYATREEVAVMFLKAKEKLLQKN